MKSKRLKPWKYLIILLVICVISYLLIARFSSFRGKVIHRSVKPLQDKTIAIDPGHGGIDGGTNHGDLLEKDINLKIGLKLKEELVKKGAKVIMTREIDESLERYIENGKRHSRDLKARVKLIEDSGADLFISIHINHIKNSKPMGPIVFYSKDNPTSQSLAEYLQIRLNGLSSYREDGTEINRVPIFGDYYILNTCQVLGVLMEVGFISSELDRRLLVDDQHQDEVVELVIQGIFDFYRE